MRIGKQTIALAGLAATMALASPANAADIREDATLQSIILTTFVVNATSTKCPDVSARRGRTQRLIVQLAERTTEMGYTKDEVNDLLVSAEAQARLAEQADQYMRSKGADPADRASVCAFADGEIKARTEVGKLLKR